MHPLFVLEYNTPWIKGHYCKVDPIKELQNVWNKNWKKDKFTVLDGDFNTHLSWQLKEQPDKTVYNTELNNISTTLIYLTFKGHYNTSDYNVFSGTHEIVTKIDHMLDHKISLNII